MQNVEAIFSAVNGTVEAERREYATDTKPEPTPAPEPEPTPAENGAPPCNETRTATRSFSFIYIKGGFFTITRRAGGLSGTGTFGPKI